MLAMVLGATESATGRHQWRQRFDNDRAESGFGRYLQFLVKLGYGPAPIERYAAGEQIGIADVLEGSSTASTDTPDSPPDGTGTDSGGPDNDQPPAPGTDPATPVA